MTGPIDPERYNELCQAERLMKFLEAYVSIYREGCGYLSPSYGQSFIERVGQLMRKHPDLIEEVTEVKVNG